jgi:hypothetical protein
MGIFLITNILLTDWYFRVIIHGSYALQCLLYDQIVVGALEKTTGVIVTVIPWLIALTIVILQSVLEYPKAETGATVACLVLITSASIIQRLTVHTSVNPMTEEGSLAPSVPTLRVPRPGTSELLKVTPKENTVGTYEGSVLTEDVLS